jgi:nitrate reductase delta subunit
MLTTFKKSAEHLQALDRVKDWTRTRFALENDDTILVSEVACNYPGCVPLETVVGFWTNGNVHHHFKIFKPVADVVEDDMPPAWLKEALMVTEDMQCSCC